MTKTREDQAESLQILRDAIKPGDRVFTLLRHVSASGMMRHITVLTLERNERGETRPHYWNYHVAKVLRYKTTEGGSLKVGGCGMDMGFHVVYSLGRVLFPEGFECIGDNCPANDHFTGDDVKHHKDGGYALRQEWL